MDSSVTYLLPQPNIPPACDPISTDNSETVSDFETQLQQAFIAVFQSALRPGLDRVMRYGMPHRADATTLERFVKAEGLAMDRGDNGEEFMREVFRAWRARNPKRGLAFLRMYLQLLYPGTATVQQLWQDPARPYPNGASATQTPGAFLTSRVRVTLANTALTAQEVSRIRSIALSVVPARIVLEIVMTVGDGVKSVFALGAAGESTQILTITGVSKNS